MKNLKHTPGPWKYTISKSGRHQISDTNGGQVCMLWIRQSDTTLANGRLIAAAPDMLDALIAAAKRERITVGGIHPRTVDAIEHATGMKIEEILA